MTGPTARLLALLSLLQARRDWPGPVLARRLDVTERTVRRDVDRLRELGYGIHTTRGPVGGYRLEGGSDLPPLLLDDDQAVALALALQLAMSPGTGLEEAAARALATIRQVMPSRLRHRVDALSVTAFGSRSGAAPTSTDQMQAVSAAIRDRATLRFDYLVPYAEQPAEPPAVRRAEPHHVVSTGHRWYVLAWDLDRDDWRTYRLDRMTLRTPHGPRFERRELPGDDVASLVAARFRGPADDGDWACRGSVVLALPATGVAPYAGDGLVEPLGPGRCRLTLDSWSWNALAATVGRFDAEVDEVRPAELARAFADLGARFTRAGG